jgi:hypothetical protein
MSLRGFRPQIPGLAPNIQQRAVIKGAMEASRLYVRPLYTLTKESSELHFIAVFRLAGHPPVVWDSWDTEPSAFTKLSLLWHVGPDLGDDVFAFDFLPAGTRQKGHDCALQVLFMIGLVGSCLINSHEDLLDTLRFRVLPLSLSTYKKQRCDVVLCSLLSRN